MPQSRQLAAIMFTDIVGYTALMGEDEQRAFELLKKNRKVQKPIIEKHNGKWFEDLHYYNFWLTIFNFRCYLCDSGS